MLQDVTTVCADQGGLPSLRQITVIQNYQGFTEGDLMAIKSATSTTTSYSEAHTTMMLTTLLLHHHHPSPGSYPELRVMCNYTSFQDTVAWTFESSETTRDPHLCAQWLEFLRGRIYNGTTQPMSLVVRSHSSIQAAAFPSISLSTTVCRRRYQG
jgi:hypothetical protein